MRLIQLACHGDDASHRALVPLLPGLITLDDWGFPVITADVPAGLHGEAVTAVGLCPRLALRLELPPPCALRRRLSR